MVSPLRRIGRPEPPSRGKIGVANPERVASVAAVIHSKRGAITWNDGRALAVAAPELAG
jgi:hypothetical protein